MRRSFEEMNPTLPETYADRKAVIRDVFEEFKTWAADTLRGPLWERVQSMPQDTHEERKTLARWINRECRSFGLAVQCPNTGKPSLLMATKIGGRRGIGAFVFQTVGDRGRKTNSGYRSRLPDLALVPDSDERRNWAESIRRRDDSRGHEGRE